MNKGTKMLILGIVLGMVAHYALMAHSVNKTNN